MVFLKENPEEAVGDVWLFPGNGMFRARRGGGPWGPRGNQCRLVLASKTKRTASSSPVISRAQIKSSYHMLGHEVGTVFIPFLQLGKRELKWEEIVKTGVESMGTVGPHWWVQILVLLSSSCVSLGKSHDLSEPQFPPL